MPAALLYGRNDLIGHLLAGEVDHYPRAVEAPEGLGRRLIILGLGQHVGGDRTELNEGGADRQAAEVGRNPAVKWESAAFDAQ